VLWPGSRPRRARHFLCSNKESAQRKSPDVRDLSLRDRLPCVARMNGLAAELGPFRASDSPRHPAARARHPSCATRRSRRDSPPPRPSPASGGGRQASHCADCANGKCRLGAKPNAGIPIDRGQRWASFHSAQPTSEVKRLMAEFPFSVAEQRKKGGVPAQRDGEDCLSSVCSRLHREQERRVPQPSRLSLRCRRRAAPRRQCAPSGGADAKRPGAQNSRAGDRAQRGDDVGRLSLVTFLSAQESNPPARAEPGRSTYDKREKQRPAATPTKQHACHGENPAKAHMRSKPPQPQAQAQNARAPRVSPTQRPKQTAKPHSPNKLLAPNPSASNCISSSC
jgi:hypothetical protein